MEVMEANFQERFGRHLELCRRGSGRRFLVAVDGWGGGGKRNEVSPVRAARLGHAGTVETASFWFPFTEPKERRDESLTFWDESLTHRSELGPSKKEPAPGCLQVNPCSKTCATRIRSGVDS